MTMTYDDHIRLVHAKMEMIDGFEEDIKKREQWIKMLSGEIDVHYEEAEKLKKGAT